MVYSPEAPYEILKTAHLSFSELQRLQRFARYWDLVVNSGRFHNLNDRLLSGGSAFRNFEAFSRWLYEKAGETHGISAKRMTKLLVSYLVEVLGCTEAEARDLSERDKRATHKAGGPLPKRQALHAGV